MSSRLDAIEDWVKEARRARYDVQNLAALCEISSSQLERYFARVFGKPPQRWLDELRICHAQRLLCTGLHVKEVAHELHFADTAHFTHLFTKIAECSPSVHVVLYRQRQRDEVDDLVARFGESFPSHLLMPAPWEVAEQKLCLKRYLPG